MAVTDRAKGKKGISAFIVERGTPGFRPGKKEDKLGVRSSDTSELVLEDCRIPAGNLLGAEGMGFIDTLRILDRGRIGIAAFSVGIAQASLEASHASTPRGASSSVTPSPSSRPSSSRSPTWPPRWTPPGFSRGVPPSSRDAGREHTAESSMAKLYASEMAVQVALDAIQIHGGYGYIKDYPVERYLRDSKLGTIGEGTSEVQRLVIARELLDLRGMVR